MRNILSSDNILLTVECCCWKEQTARLHQKSYEYQQEMSSRLKTLKRDWHSKSGCKNLYSSSFDSNFVPFTSELLELACVSLFWNRGSSPSFYSILLSSISLFWQTSFFLQRKQQHRTGVHCSLCCCFCKLFPHGQNDKCNLCASSHRVHAPLSAPLDEMTSFRDNRQPLPPGHPSPSSFQHSSITNTCWSGSG